MPDFRRTRTADPDQVDQFPAVFDPTDGGFYLRIGDQEIGVVSPDLGDDDRTHESLLRALRVLATIETAIPTVREEVTAALVDLGVTCPACDGSKVQTTGPKSEVDCPTCGGRGRVPATEVAAA